MFLNPKSGHGSADREQMIALFAARSIPAQFTSLRRGVDVKALAAAERPGIALIAAGGDGTVNCVANAVAGTDRAMGVLPAGTLNHFARDLGLPSDLEAAVDVIARGHCRRVDAGEVNGRIFVNNSSLGAYPRMVIDRERMKQSGRNKWASLVFASLRAFVRFHCLQIDLVAAGQEHTLTTPFLFVGNNRYTLDGLNTGRREHLDQAQLALYLAPGARRADVLRLALEALVGRVREDPVYVERLVPSFAVSARGRRRLRVALDGEVMHLTCPLRYRTLPGALQVLCPEPGTQEAQ